MVTTHGSSSDTRRPWPRSTTRGSPRTWTPPWRRVRKSLPRGCRDRISPGTCSPWTRPTTLGFADSFLLPSRPRRVEALRPRVQTITDDLLDAIAERSPDSNVDLVSAFAFPLPFTVICELLGVPQADRARLGQEFTKLLVPTSTPSEYAEAKAASDAVVAMLRDLVAGKETSPGDDLVSALIRARDGEDSLDSRELLSSIFQLMVAGHDTTASLIGNSVVALLRNPQQLSKLRSEPGAIPAAVEEFLRYDAPVPHSTFRYASEPLTLGDTTIPEGAQVIICLAAANRDHDRYAETGVTRRRPGRNPSPGLRARHPSLPRRAPWRAWRVVSLSAGCCDVFQSSPWPFLRRTCTGVMVTVSCCEGFPSCRSSPVPAFLGSSRPCRPRRRLDRDETDERLP